MVATPHPDLEYILHQNGGGLMINILPPGQNIIFFWGVAGNHVLGFYLQYTKAAGPMMSRTRVTDSGQCP